MSYDLHIFTRTDPTGELAKLGLEVAEDTLVLPARGWQAVFWPPNAVEKEDVPPFILRAIPDVRFCVEVTIEGSTTNASVKRTMRLARKLADACGGIVEDPQLDDFGVPAVFDQEHADRGEISLSWWFTGATEFARSGYSRFVDVLAAHLPEALPRRYGLWEPPQFKLDVQGLDHFRDFLRTNLRGTVVWYPKSPCTNLQVSVPEKVGATRQGYRCGRLSLAIRPKARKLPGGAERLKTLWLATSEVVNAFYSEIRMGESPVVSWWWNGIPRQLGMAALIGAPYVELWPTFAEIATPTAAGLLYVETLASGIPLSFQPPAEIAMPAPKEQPKTFTGPELLSFLASDQRSYPVAWPFEPPFERP